MWLNSWAIGMGLLAASAPLVIHWLTRPKPRRLPLSTLRFVKAAVEQRRSRARIRDWLILALRTAAVLLIAAAMARPMFGRKAIAASEESASIARVVLVDASQSLAAIGRDVELFDRARSLAARELAYQPGLVGNLILAGAQPRSLFTGLSTNLGALRDELEQAVPRPEALNLPAALSAAAEQLATAPAGSRLELVILSDFQRTNWASADFSGLPQATQIRLESVAPEESIGNLAILNISVAGRMEVSRPARLQVEVGNFSPTAREVRVDLRFGPASPTGARELYSSFQLSGLCAPYSRTVLSNDVIPTEAGWMAGEATLTTADGAIDALPADNTRACVWDVRPPPDIVLLSRQSGKQRPSSSFFLERALVPSDTRGQKPVRRLEPARLDPESLGTAELVVLDHPGQLSDGAVNQLAALLKRGRSLLYVAGEATDASNLQRLIDAAGTSAGLPVKFAPPRSSNVEELFVTGARQDAAPFDIFGDQLPELLRELRIVPGLVSQPVEGALREDILATLSDSSAFLTVTSSEVGCLVVLNADLEASNLAASPLLVPVLAELVQRRLLAGRRSSGQITSGEPATLFLPFDAPAVANLAITGPPAGQSQLGTLESGPSGGVWRLPVAGPPGIYTVSRGTDVIVAAASSAPASESDLRTLSAEVFEDRLAGDRMVSFRSGSREAEAASDSVWTWLALGCVLCLVCEVGVLRAFRW